MQNNTFKIIQWNCEKQYGGDFKGINKDEDIVLPSSDNILSISNVQAFLKKEYSFIQNGDFDKAKD